MILEDKHAKHKSSQVHYLSENSGLPSGAGRASPRPAEVPAAAPTVHSCHHANGSAPPTHNFSLQKHQTNKNSRYTSFQLQLKRPMLSYKSTLITSIKKIKTQSQGDSSQGESSTLDALDKIPGTTQDSKLPGVALIVLNTRVAPAAPSTIKAKFWSTRTTQPSPDLLQWPWDPHVHWENTKKKINWKSLNLKSLQEKENIL